MLRRLGLVAVFLTISSYDIVLSQTTSATISGTVRDDTGAVLPGVSIAVKDLDTGRTRAVITDDEGRYHAVNLELGNYEIQAELAGFQTALKIGVNLSVGQEVVIDFTLKVGEITEKVQVMAEAPLVETTTSSVTGLVDDKKIRDLPLNGRDFSQLAMLQAGVYAPPAMGQAMSSFGTGPKMAVSGSRPNQNNFLIDGADVQDPGGRTPGSVSGATLGVETVREFSVATSTYSAEYGKVSGGVINAVTKSGTNEFHGSVFEFLRNDNLDARNFFDRTKPEFKRNQFGFTLGGRIQKDRTFFFGSYEGLRERLGITRVNTVLTAQARQGIFPTRTIAVSPFVKPYLDLYPLPNGRDLGDGRAEFIRSVSQPTDENYFLVKIDHNISDSHSLSVRYIKDSSSQLSAKAFEGFAGDNLTARQFVTIADKLILSPVLLNEFRLSFNRNVYGTFGVQTIKLDPLLSFVPSQKFGELQVGGLSNYGVSTSGDNRVITQNMFEYGDSLSYTKGRHSMRLGAEIKRTHDNTFGAFAQFGKYVFNTVADFLAANAFQLDVLLPGSDTIRGSRQTYVGAYVQDNLTATPRLTLNLGLRWEFTTEPTEVNGKVANLINPFTDATTTVRNTLYENPGKKWFAPRLGFAWNVFGDGKTALRGGAGIFYNLISPIDYMNGMAITPPFYKRTLLNFPPFPNAFAAAASATIPPLFLQLVDVTPSQPYTYKYGLTLQREVARDMVLSVGYVGSNSIHVGRQQNLNINQFVVRPDGRKFFPADAQRTNPNFSSYALMVFDTKANYNSVQLSFKKRFSQGLQFQVSYTVSKTMDESSGNTGTTENPGGRIVSLDPYDRSRDYGLSNFHVGNVVTGNFTYDLPIKLRPALDRWIGGWQINGIVTLADGNPVEIRTGFDRSRAGNSSAVAGLIDRPDLRSGGNNNPVSVGNPNNYWDGSQFQLQEAGFLGNAGAGTLIVPGVISGDFSVAKSVSIREGQSLLFRAEFFNALNRTNFGTPNVNVFTDTSGRASATFGRITSTSTIARQIQLALKLLF